MHRISQFFRELTGSPSSSRPSSRPSSPRPPPIDDPQPQGSPSARPVPVKSSSPGASALMSAATAHAVPLLRPQSAAPSNSRSGYSEVANTALTLSANCALSLASVVAELAPIPYIGTVAQCLTFVFQAVEKSKVNKEQMKLLQGRCVMVLRIAGQQIMSGGGEHYSGVQQATLNLDSTLQHIIQRANGWNEMNVFTALVQYNEISEAIKDLFFAADTAQMQWIGEFNAVQDEELAKLETLHKLILSMNEQLDVMSQNQDTIQTTNSKILERLEQVVSQKNEILQNQNETVAVYVEAEKLVQIIRTVTDIQLPPNILVGRQCILENTLPIRSGITCDVFQASFLTTEKVAKKVFRVGTSDKDAVERYAQRFVRDAKLWATFKCEYTLPFYGVGMESAGRNKEGWQLYMVSPFMKNFDAAIYLKKYRGNPQMKEGIMRIITDAAEGLKYLHSRKPPVVHSGIRGDNILITDSGGGVLGGFGLTKVLSAGDAPPAVMTGRTDSYRWMAPEMLSGDTPVLQTSSDVWSWGMAALELIGGYIPFHKVKQPWEVMLKLHGGARPARADYPDFEHYALKPDAMWALLEQCWNVKPEDRPVINLVLDQLEQMSK
ncbi:hypothetical protein FRC09_008173 [Ceratobasidium sp. 395]|nr:hypothetical protein FRC09_008173 [Ceratobasidium sp. 395]